MSHAWDYKEKIPWGAAPPEAKKSPRWDRTPRAKGENNMKIR